MKIRKLKLIISAALALFACSALRADMNPAHYIDPSVCQPPAPPAPGQPGYGPTNPFSNGIYYNPDSGLWYIPEGLYNDTSSFDRDIEIIEELMAQAQRPAWAISDPLQDGTYYWGGGYWNGHYFGEGYYLPNEIY